MMLLPTIQMVLQGKFPKEFFLTDLILEWFDVCMCFNAKLNWFIDFFFHFFPQSKHIKYFVYLLVIGIVSWMLKHCHISR